MKRLLFLLLFLPLMAISQVVPPDATPLENIQITNNVSSTTATRATVQENNGVQNYIPITALPIPLTPVNYSIPNNQIISHLSGIDTRLGQIGNTTAGLTARIYFTGDNTTVTAGTFFASNSASKGTVAAASPTALVNGDNIKQYFNKDLISIAQPSTTVAPPGNYSGQLSVSTTPTPNGTQQRYTIEIYRCNNGGTPIASGVSGAPTGDLGVTVVAILDSGLINLVAGSITNVTLSGVLTSAFTLNTGERLRYHVSGAKVGTGGGNITMNVFYGSNYNSFYDITVTPTTDGVINKSLVAGVTSSDAFNNLDASAVHKTGTLTETITGAKTISNSVFNRTSFFQFENNYNSVSNNRTVLNSPFNIVNRFGGVGGHFSNELGGWGLYGFNQATGVLLGLDSKTGSAGDLIQFSKNEITTAGIKQDGSLYTSYGIFGTSSNTSLPQLTVTNGSNPSVIEFPKTGFTIKGTVGSLGSYEMNMSTNMDYTTSPGVHRLYDNTKDATWLAIFPEGWQMQYAASDVSAGDVWNNQGRPLHMIQYKGMMRINTTASLTVPGSTFGDSMFGVRRNAGFASISGESDLAIEGGKTKGVSAPVFINTYNSGNVTLVAGGGSVVIGTAPTTSAGTFSFLTHNSSTNVVEKVLSNTIATIASPALTGTPTAPTATTGTNTNQIATTAFVLANARPYKSYVALISQSGTAAPTATVVENTLGGTVTFSRTSAGNYLATLTGAFTASKTVCYITATSGSFIHQSARNSANDVYISTLNASNVATDTILSGTTFEIRVYN